PVGVWGAAERRGRCGGRLAHVAARVASHVPPCPATLISATTYHDVRHRPTRPRPSASRFRPMIIACRRQSRFRSASPASEGPAPELSGQRARLWSKLCCPLYEHAPEPTPLGGRRGSSGRPGDPALFGSPRRHSRATSA